MPFYGSETWTQKKLTLPTIKVNVHVLRTLQTSKPTLDFQVKNINYSSYSLRIRYMNTRDVEK